ncbi:MAG: diguanylate cyclase, partial [Candidatus Electrothrix sp. AUS1_2]|nr:diguanylate cyclase [Candidatus Electrothrix sp. AUS1_2]
ATRQELDHFRTVLDQTHDCVFMFDPETLLFTYVNQGGQNQVGYSKEEFLRMTPPDIKPEYNEAVFKKMITPLTEGKTEHLFFETLHQHKNGTAIPVEIHLQYIHPAHGAACFVAVVRDITERKQAEEALKTAHQRLLTVLDGLDAIVYVIDMDAYEVLFVNKYAYDIFGDITGSICWKTLQKGLDGPCDFCPNELLHSNGEYAGRSYIWERENPFDGRWYEMHDRAIQWLDDREVKIQIATDITERRRIAQQLHYTAYHDSLTGAANRLSFYERFDEEVAGAEKSGSKLALIFIDLNNFKPINDQYGHDIGDLLLQEVSRRLLSSVRQTDLVARMGGDEFVLLFPGMRNNDDVLRVQDQINETLGKSFQISSGVEIVISAAQGTAVYPDDGLLADELLNVSDQRMFVNKRNQKRSLSKRLEF